MFYLKYKNETLEQAIKAHGDIGPYTHAGEAFLAGIVMGDSPEEFDIVTADGNVIGIADAKQLQKFAKGQGY